MPTLYIVYNAIRHKPIYKNCHNKNSSLQYAIFMIEYSKPRDGSPIKLPKELFMTDETTFYEECGIDATPFINRKTITQDGETTKLQNAMLRDRKMQDIRYDRDAPAHIIMNDYRRAAISKEQAIFLMWTNCARSRGTTLLIMEKSGADEEHKRSLATLQMEEQMLLVLEGRYICR